MFSDIKEVGRVGETVLYPQHERAWPHLKVRANPDITNSWVLSDDCTLHSQ